MKSKSGLAQTPAVLTLSAMLLLPAASALADSFWVGGTSTYNDPNSWNPVGVPLQANGNVNADNDNGINNIVLIRPEDPAWNPWDIRAGNGAGASGAFLQTGSQLDVGGWFRLAVGTGSTGRFVLSNGVVNCHLEAHVAELGTAYLEIDGGTFQTLNNNIFCVGDGDFGTSFTPEGTMVINNGTVVSTGEFWVGEANNSVTGTGIGHLTINGGSLTVHNWLAIGRFGGYGDVTLNAGSITKDGLNGGNITIASKTSVASLNQLGGTVTNTATETWIAEGGVGSWNLTNGAAVLGVVHLTQNAGAQGTFNLSGGDLTATEITDNGGVNGGTGILNLNGGTIHAGADSLNFIHDVNGGVYIQAGGVTFNTEGHNITISQALYSDGSNGGLTKTGNGTLTLAGVNSYTGPTTVNSGQLAISTTSQANGAYTVADHAGLSVLLANAGEQLNMASLTLGATTNSFDLGAFGTPANAPVNVTGNYAANGHIVINITDTLPQLGQFPLIKYGSKSGSATYSLGNLPTGVTASIVDNAANNSIDLNITSIAVNRWEGQAGGNWDINVTTNWINPGTGLPTKYTDGSIVAFNDQVTGTTLINLVQAVQPSAITILNNTSNFTLVGVGSIGGAIGLNKQGAARFTIGNTNSYTGATTVSGGTLVVSNLANGGVNSAIGASSAGSTNLQLAGGTLSYAGPPVTINRSYNLQFNYNSNGVVLGGSIDTPGSLTLSSPVTASPNSSFAKTGAGTLAYTAVGTNELSGGAFPGYTLNAGTVVFDGSAGKQVNHIQSEFWIGNATNAPAHLILTNTTLNVDSWFALGRGNGIVGYSSDATLYNSTLNCTNYSLGYWANVTNNLQSPVMTLNNSTVNDHGAFNLGESAGSLATLNLNGSSTFTMNGPLLCGLQSGSTGIVVMANSSIITNNAWASVGANGYGTLTMKDNAVLVENSDFNLGDYGAAETTGILNIQDNARINLVFPVNASGVYVGKTVGAIGIVNQTGGTIDARNAREFQLAQLAGSTGTWLQSGGTNYAGGWVSIGRGANSGDTSPNGTLVVSGGLFDQTSTGNGLIVGEQGTGTLTITNNGLVISEANNVGVAIGWNLGIGIVNLDGGTLVANFIQGGTGNSTFNFNGGVLRAGPNARYSFMTNLSAVYIFNSSVIDTDTNTVDVSVAIYDGGPGGNLTKKGSGTLLLDGASYYSGATIVTAGTLGGNGSLYSPITVQSGATLSPGTGIGTLTTSGSTVLAAGSRTLMEVNKTTASSDQFIASGGLTYGGTLVLKNTGGTLAPGDTFTLFPTPGTGSFSSVQSFTPGQTVTWDTSSLNVDGTVKVASVAPATASITPVVNGNNLTLSWPASQTGFILQMQNNPLTVGISTNWVNVAGSDSTNSVTIPINPANGSVFYRLVLP